MTDGKTLVLVMAGGEGKRLEVLTEERAKPSMPFAGLYRLIDFPLSNCVHSGLSDVWLVEQYESHSINEYVANGRPWDLDRTHGGLRLLPPYLGDEASGWHQGNADAVYKNKSLIEEFEPDHVIVLSADHIYKLDYGEVLTRHVDQKADLTMVTTKVSRDEAGRFGVVHVDDGRVVRFDHKPDSPDSDLVTTEVFVFRWSTLTDVLEEFSKEASKGGKGESSLEDFGDQLVPRLVEDGNVHEFRHDGYWRDVGTIEAYWESHMDLLGREARLDVSDPAWPILTRGPTRSPAYIDESANVERSMLSPGCRIRGRVVSSVLSPGVIVEEGAEVQESVLLHDVVVRSGASVQTAIVDAEVEIGAGARVGRARASGRTGGGSSDVSAEEVAVVGVRAAVRQGASVRAGDRVKPASMVR
ncbi:MAG TPA: glucose-1-phosphate adenylyltransferase family protein [Actinomycetota bacterium]|nr:glucose-1-phosphate adenylyltransferase family protein [Actinomycetota bacterium]